MKRPSFQFYPGDWQANSNLRRCTHEEKGIWLDVMCLLHDQEEYGIARWTLKELAKAIGTTVSKLNGIVNKGVLKGADHGTVCQALIYIPRSGRKDGDPVTLIESQPGPLWYSSRMVIDEYKRIVRGEAGEASKDAPKPSPKGGIGEAPKQSPDDHLSRARPSSSSLSSTSETKTPAPAEPARFDALSALKALEVPEPFAKDYLAIRKTKRLPLTETALKALLREFSKAGLSAPDAIKKCCEESWAGFKAEWVTDQGGNGKQGDKSWMFSEKGIEAKARELGIRATGHDSYHTLKQKCLDRIALGSAAP